MYCMHITADLTVHKYVEIQPVLCLHVGVCVLCQVVGCVHIKFQITWYESTKESFGMRLSIKFN